MEAELSDEDEADGEEGVDFVKICTQFGAKQTFEYISNWDLSTYACSFLPNVTCDVTLY